MSGFALVVCASDKRITCDEEFSDSEDEGDRKNHENFKSRKRAWKDSAEKKENGQSGK